MSIILDGPVQYHYRGRYFVIMPAGVEHTYGWVLVTEDGKTYGWPGDETVQGTAPTVEAAYYTAVSWLDTHMPPGEE